MLSIIIKPLTLLVSAATLFGVFIHDTRIDNALLSGTSNPGIIASYNSGEIKLSSNEQHIHSENVSVSSALSLNYQQPATQPRNQDDKKYIAQKRLMGSGSDNEYSWPTI